MTIAPGPSTHNGRFQFRVGLCLSCHEEGQISGAAKYKFKQEWIVKYPFVSYVTSDKSLFHFNVWNRTLSCAHQAEADLMLSRWGGGGGEAGQRQGIFSVQMPDPREINHIWSKGCKFSIPGILVLGKIMYILHLYLEKKHRSVKKRIKHQKV